MNFIVLILKNVKNLFPYFILIAIYFLFINLETIRIHNNNKVIQKGNELNFDKLGVDDKELIIKLPVIPYEN